MRAHTKYRTEILNSKFGMLTPIECVGTDSKSKRTLWLCRCDCGKEKIIRSDCLRQKSSTSCGCKQKRSNSEHHSWKGYAQLSRSKWNAIKRDALKRNLSFEITIEDAWNLLKTQEFKCALSGIDIGLSNKSSNVSSTASLDRIDSNKGYELTNIWWIYKDINIMKWDLELSHFMNLCKAITEFNNNENRYF